MSNKEKRNSNIADEAERIAGEPLEEELAQAANEAANDEETAESAPREEDKVQEMGEKLAALNDKYLRLYSEYENYRKRTTTEKADLLLNGSREMMKAILPVIDDFERALQAKDDDEGVRLIYNKMIKILEQKGLKAMETMGVKFDENLHEAITRIPATAPEQKGMVMDVVEKGYYLNDKVLRYAKVVVAC